VLRIGVGALLLWDLAGRARDLTAHYTEAGMLPRAALTGGPGAWLPHGLVSGSPEAVALLFALAAASAAAVLLGTRTRAACLVSFVLLHSLQERNPGLNFGGDVMLRMLLLLGAFLPLGARFSLDARRAGSGSGSASDGGTAGLVASGASLAFLLQLAGVYVFTVAHRTGSTWWEGDALFLLLHWDLFARPFALWLREQEAWLPWLNHATMGLETAGPVLLFCPVARGPVRTALVLAFVGFHTILALSFGLGLFGPVFVVAWLGVLPPWAWERLGGAPARRVRARPGWRRWADAVPLAVVAWMVFTNARDLTGWPGGDVWQRTARGLGIDQHWALIGRAPVHDGWYVLKGIPADGTPAVDLLDPSAAPRWAKPDLVSDRLPTRWARLFFDTGLQPDDPRWEGIARLLCRQGGLRERVGPPLERVALYFVRETTTREGPERGPILTLRVERCPGTGDAPAPDAEDSRPGPAPSQPRAASSPTT
jgi:hypothetical protein